MRIQTFSILAGTGACNASCPYCISRMTGKKISGKQKINWRNFHKACRLAQVNNVSTVLITGKGEPALYPGEITEYLLHMKRSDFPLIELQTNALALEKKPELSEKYLKEWYKLGLNTIAISIVHYEKAKNKEVFTPHGDYINLENVIKKLHNLGFSVRLSCVLMKGFIDKVEKIKKLIGFARKNDVEQLTLRKLGIMDNTEDKKTKEWCLKHALPEKELDKIKEFFNKNAKTLMTLSHGAVVYELGRQNVCLTDCEMIKPKSDEIRTMVFFPDGHLRWNWEYGGAILL